MLSSTTFKKRHWIEAMDLSKLGCSDHVMMYYVQSIYSIEFVT